MADRRYQSWGRYPKAARQAVRHFERGADPPLPAREGETILPFGNGRSYGDVCLNDGGTVVDCRGLNRILEFDAERGVLVCEAGTMLSEILDAVVPKGWFLPVTPGTRFVTVGGAIANDVHGKNHHRAGTFGRHVRRFELLRTDGTRLFCSREENPDWFRATVGGLGLTGFVAWAEIRLKKIAGPVINQETVRFHNLTEFFQLSEESDRDFEYTVAWVDCLAKGASLGRGMFMRGNHAEGGRGRQPRARGSRFTFAIDPPFSLVNSLSLRLFNTLYFHKQRKPCKRQRVHYEPFFYPLDAILEWNRIYGSRGFLQYQCVVPHDKGEAAIREILERISSSGEGSFLAVLKQFGEVSSPGLLSFPRPGVSLALDFPNQASVFELLAGLDEVTRSAGGAVYPAKDARMSAKSFQAFYPNWRELVPFIDSRVSSGFWRRATVETG